MSKSTNTLNFGFISRFISTIKLTSGCCRATNGTGGGGAQAQAQIEDLNNQMMEMKLTVEGLEKERDFYFGEM